MAQPGGSDLAIHADLAAVLRTQAAQAGAASPAVRGSDWRQAVVSTVGTDGTVTTSDGIIARRLATYVTPAVGETIIISNSSTGNWLAVGRPATSSDAVGQVLFAYKTADTSRTSTTTRTADPHLAVAVSANAVYTIDVALFYTASAAGDIDMAFTTPSGANGSWTGHGAGLSAASDTAGYPIRTELNTITQNRGFGGTGTNLSTSIRGLLRTAGTAGMFTLVWSQRVLDATTATTVFTDSWLRLQRLA